MSGGGRSKAAKQRRHAKAMAKRKAAKDARKKEWQALAEQGLNSKSRAKRLSRLKNRNKLVKDHKGVIPYGLLPTAVSPSHYAMTYW